MYIELIPDALYKLTYPEPTDESEKTSFPSDKEVFTKKETCPSHEVRTNTKNTTETTTKTTTTAHARDVVEQAVEIFAPLRLSRDDIRAIVREAEYDIDRCIKAKADYDAYRTPIGNATGLLISFMREETKNGYSYYCYFALAVIRCCLCAGEFLKKKIYAFPPGITSHARIHVRQEVMHSFFIR